MSWWASAKDDMGAKGRQIRTYIDESQEGEMS